MSQSNEGVKSIIASEAIGRRIRVKLNTSGQVAIAGAGEEAIGTVTRSIASGGLATVKLDSASGTHEVTASGTVTAKDNLYSAAAGAMANTINGRRQGIALESTTTGLPVEMMPTGVNS